MEKSVRDWTAMTGRGWTGLEWTRLDWTAMTGLDYRAKIALYWTILHWTELDCLGSQKAPSRHTGAPRRHQGAQPGGKSGQAIEFNRIRARDTLSCLRFGGVEVRAVWGF